MAACWFMFPGGPPIANAKSTFTIGDSNFLLNGKPFQIKAAKCIRAASPTNTGPTGSR